MGQKVQNYIWITCWVCLLCVEIFFMCILSFIDSCCKRYIYRPVLLRWPTCFISHSMSMKVCWENWAYAWYHNLDITFNKIYICKTAVQPNMHVMSKLILRCWNKSFYWPLLLQEIHLWYFLKWNMTQFLLMLACHVCSWNLTCLFFWMYA